MSSRGRVAGTVAIVTRGHIDYRTVACLVATEWRIHGAGPINLDIIPGSILPTQRNMAANTFQGEWLLFIDDDMVWPPEAVQALVASWRSLRDPLAIVGALCFARNAPYPHTLRGREWRTGLEALPVTPGLVEVDATGCAFLLIPRSAFDAVARVGTVDVELPGAIGSKQRVHVGSEPFMWSGRSIDIAEDFGFCIAARAAGCRVYVDTRIEIGHLAEGLPITRRWHGRSEP